MGKKIFKSRDITLLAYSGKVYRFNQYKLFNQYVKAYCNTPFARVYVLLKRQSGVFRFKCGNNILYTGYSFDLFTRVRDMYFKHCFDLNNVTFEYYLTDNPKEAIKQDIIFSQPLQVEFMDYYTQCS